MIKMLNPGQEPQASSKAPNQDLKEMNIHCTFKIKIQNKDVSMTNDNIQIKIKMKTPVRNHQHPPIPNQDLKDMDVLCTFKIKIKSQNLEYWRMKD